MIKLGNSTTIMLPFNLASEAKWSKNRGHTYVLNLHLYRQYTLMLHKTDHIHVIRYDDWKYYRQWKSEYVFGHIHPSGELEATDRLPNGALKLLKRFAVAPLRMIHNSENETKYCVFCDRRKTRAHGPVCEWWLSNNQRYSLR